MNGEMDKDEVAKRIMDYLHKHPDAGDTLEGIAKWWVKLEKIDESIENVSNAIEGLIKKGLIRTEEIKGGRQIYRICKEN